MKRKSVFSKYLLCLFLLLLMFAVAFGVVRAQENSERMRTGEHSRTVDYRDVSAFFDARFSEIVK